MLEAIMGLRTPPEVAPHLIRRSGQRVDRAGTEKWRRFNKNALIRGGDRRDRNIGDRIVGSAAV